MEPTKKINLEKDNEIIQKMENGELFDGTNAFTLPIKDNWISVKKEMPEEKDGVSDTCVVCLGPGLYKMTYTENGVWKHLNRLEQKLVMYWMKIAGPFEAELTERPFRKETVDEEKIREIAIESLERLRQLASAEHVARAWNNYVNGFKAGYKRAKEE